MISGEVLKYRKGLFIYAGYESGRSSSSGFSLTGPCEDADGNKHPENVFGRDELLDNVMFYWLTATGASSARVGCELLFTTPIQCRRSNLAR